jgi:hypothetical protein
MTGTLKALCLHRVPTSVLYSVCIYFKLGIRKAKLEIKNSYVQRRYLFAFRTERTKKSTAVGMSRF